MEADGVVLSEEEGGGITLDFTSSGKGNDSIEMLLNKLVKRIAHKINQSEHPAESLDEFSCPLCLELLFEPVTFICGHSMCKKCANVTCCKICNMKLVEASSHGVNVLLFSILQKQYPTEYEGMSIIAEGDELMRKKSFQAAISKYTEAIRFVPHSHTASQKRATAYLANGDVECALEDSDRVRALASKWPKGYFTQGEVLIVMERNEEALLNFLICSALDPSNANAISNAVKIVINMIMSEGVEQHDNFSASAGKRKPNEETVSEMKRKRTTSQQTNSPSEFKFVSECMKHQLVTETSTSTSKQTETNPSVLKLTTNENQQGTLHDSKNISVEEHIPGYSTSSRSKITKDVMDVITELASSVISDYKSMPDKNDGNESSSIACQTFNKSLLHVCDFECSLCLGLYFEPVCTTCGHLFCKGCLERCLDHSPKCPLCKSALNRQSGNETFNPSIDVCTTATIKRFLPEEYNKSLKRHEGHIEHIKKSIPIFVCTLAFPSVSCPLHIYEPRYRLMLRRVLDIHGKEFGMCKKLDKEFHKMGTILQIQKATFFQNGTSVIQSIGTKRFEVIEQGVCDGYATGRVKYIVDDPVTDVGELAVLKKLMKLVYVKVKDWYNGLRSHFKEQIKQHFGEIPDYDDSLGDSGPDWTWWALAVSPVEDQIKSNALGNRLLRNRLLIIYRIFTFLLHK